MNLIDKIIDINTTEEQSDQLLKQLITTKMNNDFRASFELKLKNQPTSKSSNIRALTIRKRNWLLTLSSIAAGLLILILMNPFKSNSDTAQLMAMNLLEKSALAHPGSSRSASLTSQVRSAAILYFNKVNYQEALLNFNKIENLSDEDTFYMGLSNMMISDYKSAIIQLTETMNTTLYRQESQYYLILLHILNNEEGKAVRLIEGMGKSDFKFTECRSLREKLLK